MERHIPKPLFLLVADHERKIYDMFGVEDSKLAAIKSIKKVPTWIESSIKHKLPSIFP